MADIILGILMLAAILGFAIWVGAAIGGGIESGLLNTYDLKKNPYDHRLGGEAWGGIIGLLLAIGALYMFLKPL